MRKQRQTVKKLLDIGADADGKSALEAMRKFFIISGIHSGALITTLTDPQDTVPTAAMLLFAQFEGGS